MLYNYLNGKATYKEREAEPNKYNEYDYKTAVEIPVRKQKKLKVIKKSDGEEITITCTYYTTHQCLENSLIDNQPIIFVEEWRDLQDFIVGYKVMI